MSKYDYGSDEKLQEWIGKQQTSVTKAMMTGGGPLTRAYRGGKSFAKSKMKSPWSERKDVEQDVFSETLSKGLRLFGKTKAAEWVDRFTARTKFPTDKAKGPKEPTSKVGDVQVSNQGMMKELTTIKGSLVRIESNVGLLNAAVMDTREDVSDIKKLLMPTNLVASGEGDKYGEQQYVQYNPLAPKGSQFLKQQTLEIEGEPVRGKLINRAPDEEFMQNAIRMAAVETASTVLRIQRKDEKKQQRLERRRTNLANDTWAYNDPLEPDRDFFKKFIDDAGGKVETVEKEDDGILDDAIDIGIGAAIASALPGALKTALSGAAGILAPALTAALPLGLMAAFTKFAETADINNPGKNPLALIGHYGLKFSEFIRGETVEEARKKREEFDRQQRDRASRGEIDMSVAMGKAPPGMHWEGNQLVYDDVNRQSAQEAARREGLRQAAERMRQHAETSPDLTEAQRQQARDAAAALEAQIPTTPLTRRADDPKTVKDFIVAGANRAGMDPRIMMAMAAQESGFNPNAQATTSSAKGLFQFINETWNHMKRKYGNDFTELDKGPFDPEASALAGALYARENAEFLKSAGLPVNATSLYTAHFLGPGGAKKVLEADPNMNANELLPNAARSNVGIFMKKEDGRFVPRTVGELQELLYQKIGSKVEQIGYQLTSEYGHNYKQYGTTPRWDADIMDQDSRMVAEDHRGGKSGETNVTLVSQNNPARTPPPPAATTVPRATGLTSDDTLRNAGAADSVLPALS